MKITQAHVVFWTERHAPNWAKLKKYPDATRRTVIDSCVNAHANLRYEYLDASNLLSILRLVRKRNEDLADYLDGIARNPGTLINPSKRAAFAKKWAFRIRRERILALIRTLLEREGLNHVQIQ